MTEQIKILIVVDNNTTTYTDHVYNTIITNGYSAEKITLNALQEQYNKIATAPSFFIVKNNKAAYMLPGKREISKIIQWIKDSNLI